MSTLTNIYNNPDAAYLGGATCLINLSSIADFTLVPSITQCGHTVTFVAPREALDPRQLATAVGGAGQTEISNPDVLYTNGATMLQIRFSSPRRIAGVEASPQLGTAQSFKADYIDASGNSDRHSQPEHHRGQGPAARRQDSGIDESQRDPDHQQR